MPYSVRPTPLRGMFPFYKLLRLTRPYTALLERLCDDRRFPCQYAIVGILPAEALIRKGAQTHLVNLRTDTQTDNVSWIEVLDSWSSPFSNGTSPFPFQTGAIGYIGYDSKHEFERLTRRIMPDVGIPDVCLVRYDAILFCDVWKNEAYWAINNGFEQECAKIEMLLMAEQMRESKPFGVKNPITTDFNHEQYLDAVRKTVEYIRNGDIFQANITGRFSTQCTGDPIELYEQLRETTPNPYFALLDFPDPVISTSPELFFSVREGRIISSPIKGTVECDKDGVDQRAVLENSDKDRAENVMIVDLMRNDIGRVCVKDTVQVDTLCEIKRFNNLYHLESTVSGSLKPETRTSDILRALFPCGSVTGAPKIRAMEIIEELEDTCRGPYTGAIGFFGSNGWIETSVAIRTLYCHDGTLYMHAGGGIVADSTPDAEYRELNAKLHRIRETIETFRQP